MGDVLRRFHGLMEVAGKAGYSEEAAKDLITEPQTFVEQAIGKKLAAKLTPETITALFNGFEGKEIPDTRSLLELGNVLYDFENNLEKLADKKLTPEETKLLSFVNQLLEQAFYRGGLSELSEKEAAAIAFLVNRLAKLKDRQGARTEVHGFDVKKFIDFADEVETFADGYVSEETVGELIRKNLHETMAIEEQLEKEDNPAIKNYIAEIAKGRVATQRLDELHSGELYKIIQDMRHKLLEIRRLFEEIFGDEKDDNSFKKLDFIITELGNVTKEEAVKVLNNNLRRSGGDLLGFILEKRKDTREVKNLKIEENDTLYTAILDVINMYVYNLKNFRDKIQGKKVLKDFKELRDKALADQITDELLEVIGELSGLSGVQKEIKVAQDTLTATDKAHEKLSIPAKREPDDQVPKLLKRYGGLALRFPHLIKERQLVPTYRERFARSKKSVVSDMRQNPVGDLYFLKVALVAADKVTKKSGRGNVFDIWRSEDRDPVRTHEILKYTQKERYGSDNIDYSRYGEDEGPTLKYKYSDIHYKTSHLVFATVMTEFLRKQRRQENKSNSESTTEEL